MATIQYNTIQYNIRLLGAQVALTCLVTYFIEQQYWNIIAHRQTYRLLPRSVFTNVMWSVHPLY